MLPAPHAEANDERLAQPSATGPRAEAHRKTGRSILTRMHDTTMLIQLAMSASADVMKRAAAADLVTIGYAADAIAERVLAGASLFTFGNGGSATDAEHFAAEILGRFARDRRPLAAHALTSDSATLTAIANDYGYDEVFARQLRGLAKPADVCVGISTSGESINVVKGLQAARDTGALTIALSGRDGGPVASAASIAIVIAERDTARIQEVHRTIIHAICQVVESRLA